MRYLDVDGVGRVSRIGLGTWQFGSREWGYGDTYASGAARDIVQRSLGLGVTLFDTAEVYGLGKSEQRSAISAPRWRWPARSFQLLRVTVLAHGRGVPVEADPGVNWPRSNGSGRGVRGRGVAAAVRVSRAGCHGWFR